MAKLLEESTAVPVATGTPGLWRATLITPGSGSSGNWLEETIKRDGPHALKKGAKCFVTHNRTENGEPDPFRMWGVLAEDSRYEEGTGLVADIQVLPSWKDRVEEVAPHTALSVYLMGESDDKGNITAILEDVQNGVDMVAYPGRPGSALVEKLYESAIRSAEENHPAAPAGDGKDEKGLLRMDQETKDAFAALNARIDGLAEADKTKVQAEVDEAAIAEKVKEGVKAHLDVTKKGLDAIEAAKADLLESHIKELTDAAYDGNDVTAAIESAKKIAAEGKALGLAEAAKAAEAAVVETGRFGEASSASTYELGGFGSHVKKEAK